MTPRTFKIGDRVSYNTTMLPWVTIGGVVLAVSLDGLTISIKWDDLMHADMKASNSRLEIEK